MMPQVKPVPTAVALANQAGDRRYGTASLTADLVAQAQDVIWLTEEAAQAG
jgi:hypothetical protein